MLRHFFLFQSVLLVLSAAAFSRELCFKGSLEERRYQATDLIQKLVSVNPLPSENTILRALPLINPKPSISSQLAVEIEKLGPHGCEFTDEGRFGTLGETLSSMTNEFYEKPAPPPRHDVVKVGLKMGIFPTTAPNYIYFRVTEDGFVFHVCGQDDKDFTNAKVYPSDDCRFLIPGGAPIPVDQMLYSITSFQHMKRVFLKALGQMTVVVTSNLSLGLLSPIASSVSSYLEQDSMARIKNDYMVYKMVTEIIKIAAISDQDQSFRQGPPQDDILTRMVPFTFDDLSTALIDVTTAMIKVDTNDLKRLDASPGNPSLENLPGLKMQRAVNRYYNALYHEGKTAPKTDSN